MIRLRPFADGDLLVFKKWLYAPHVAKWYHDPLDWIAEAEQREGGFRWIHHFIVEHDGKPIGFCQYYACRDSGEPWGGYAAPDGAYSIDYVIGESDCIGRGFGKATVLALIGRIRGRSDATEIVVQPEKENGASCGTLLSCGFTYLAEHDVYVLPL